MAHWLLTSALALVTTFVPTPPARYTGDTTTKVQFMDPEEVPSVCAHLIGISPPDGMHYAACTTPRVIILPNPCKWPVDSDYRQLVCHELGHRNGWPADHPSE